MMHTLQSLFDHPSVYRLPDKEQPKSKILEEEDKSAEVDSKAAFESVKRTLQGKRKGINDLLEPTPEEPEYDTQEAKRNREMAKKAAILQVFDAVAGVGEQALFGDKAVVAPADFSQIGLEALNNLVRLDEEYRIQLKDYNQQKADIERENRQIRQEVREHNADIDLDIAERELSQAERKRREHHQAALRYISQGNIELGEAHMKAAGLTLPDLINGIDSAGRETLTALTPPEPIKTEKKGQAPSVDPLEMEEIVSQTGALAQKIKSGKASESDVEQWEKNFIRIATEEGFNEEEIQAETEKALRLLVNGTAQNNPSDPAPEDQQISPVNTSEGTTKETDPIDEAYEEFKNAGVQVESRQTERFKKVFGDKWRDILYELKQRYPDRSEDFLKYLMLEKTEIVRDGLRETDVVPTLEVQPFKNSGIGRGEIQEIKNNG